MSKVANLNRDANSAKRAYHPGENDYSYKYKIKSEADGTADCMQMTFCGSRRSPEFLVIAPQNAGLERESYTASDTIRGQRRYFPTRSK